MTGTLRGLLSEVLEPVSGPRKAAAPFSIACNSETAAYYYVLYHSQKSTSCVHQALHIEGPLPADLSSYR